jgi:hypothetical protein
MAKKKAMGLPISPASLITSPAILVRHLICPQFGRPAVCICLTGGHLLTQLQGLATGVGQAAECSHGSMWLEWFQAWLGLSSFRRQVQCCSSTGACCDLVACGPLKDCSNFLRLFSLYRQLPLGSSGCNCYLLIKALELIKHPFKWALTE